MSCVPRLFLSEANRAKNGESPLDAPPFFDGSLGCITSAMIRDRDDARILDYPFAHNVLTQKQEVPHPSLLWRTLVVLVLILDNGKQLVGISKDNLFNGKSRSMPILSIN
jgi:hypothetical protein